MNSKTQMTGQPDDGTMFHKKIVPMINSILSKAGKKSSGGIIAWITFKKKFNHDSLFNSDEWEVSKSDIGGQSSREITYLIIVNGDCVFEARELKGKITVKTFDQVDHSDWPRLFFLLRNRIKAGKIK